MCLNSVWRLLAVGVFWGEFCQGHAALPGAGWRTPGVGGLVDCLETFPRQRLALGKIR